MQERSVRSYKTLIRERLALLKKIRPDRNFSNMARETGVQKTYISRVLNRESIHFSREQLRLICRYLDLPEQQTDLCVSLHEFEVTQDKKLRAEIRQKIDRMLDVVSDVGHGLDLPRPWAEEQIRRTYYSTSVVSLVHMMLTLPYFQSRPEEIREHLGISESELQFAVDFLERSKFIEVDRVNKSYRVLNDTVHLESQDPMFRSFQNDLKMRSQIKEASLPHRQKISFLTTFSCSRENKIKIESTIKNSLEEIRKLVENDKNTEVLLQLNLSFFGWTS